MLNCPGIGIGPGPGVGARLLADGATTAPGSPPPAASRRTRARASITRALGKRKYVRRRFVKNNRLNHAGSLWAFATLTHSKGANAHTGGDAKAETGTPKHCGTCSIACSDSSTTACCTAVSSMKSQRSP
jgi:hypothetical protein